MWSFTDPETRPDYIVFTFLPISFLTGVIGAGYLFYLERKEKARLVVVPEKDLENGEGTGSVTDSNDGTLTGAPVVAVPLPVRDNWVSCEKL
jgi:hypothetical protein